MDKKEDVVVAGQEAPQTFEEALDVALRGLLGTISGISDDWLEALNREKDASHSELIDNQKLTITK